MKLGHVRDIALATLAVVIVAVIWIAYRETRDVRFTRDEDMPRRADISPEAQRRIGAAEVITRSFANHDVGMKVAAHAAGDDSAILVLDITSEPCTERSLRMAEVIMGADNVVRSGFTAIVCAGGRTSIVP